MKSNSRRNRESGSVTKFREEKSTRRPQTSTARHYQPRRIDRHPDAAPERTSRAAIAESWKAINRGVEARYSALDQLIDQLAANCEDSFDRDYVHSRWLKIREDGKKHAGRPGRPAGIEVNGPKLEQLRKAKKMTQSKLAKAASKELGTSGGFDRRTIQRYEQSGRADSAHVEALARVFGVSPTSLWARFHGVVLIPSRPTDFHRMVSLPPELEQFVQSCLASGLYQNASQVVREGLRLLKECELSHSSVPRAEEEPYTGKIIKS